MLFFKPSSLSGAQINVHKDLTTVVKLTSFMVDRFDISREGQVGRYFT